METSLLRCSPLDRWQAWPDPDLCAAIPSHDFSGNSDKRARDVLWQISKKNPNHGLGAYDKNITYNIFRSVGRSRQSDDLRVCEGCEVESVVRTKWRGVGLGPRDKRRKLNHKNTIKGENTFPPFAVAWPVSVRNDRESSSEQ